MLISLLSLLLLFLTACGGTNQATSTPADNGKPGGHLVKHAMGQTMVPDHPQRVVVLDTGELDDTLALGITPVGAVTALQDGDYLSYLKGKLGSITNVGTIAQPNLEKIASLHPDLILSNKVRHASIYPQLSQIAPTVFAENIGTTWKDNLKLYAEALGKTQEANTLLQHYNQRLAELKQKMGPRLAQTHVSIVRVLPDRIRLYMGASFIGTILRDAGLPRPPAQDQDKKFAQEVTYENIQTMDGDVIFIMNYGNSKDKMQDLMNQPQWKQLNAVKNGKVFTVADDVWSTGIGIEAANLVIDDLFKYLVSNGQ
ncbi:iron-siderophore ABC transporter substrate-binding protein [Ktedonosporobacter rubrisoli]|uniref:Iron-siderophore ABC transporter substrate-binding protein n=2 Tax=Ktedonosporobacter rubrisoli TaxID=2509675 RepID=A0A4P6K5A0_KTERU|nr:iron-siderophore ABC transporter substrate-binding protein [Ktedonosporobacter rubrisoli]